MIEIYLKHPNIKWLLTILSLVNIAQAQTLEYKFGDGYKHLASGLVCGLSSLVSIDSIN
jgi:hypothetical protein